MRPFVVLSLLVCCQQPLNRGEQFATEEKTNSHFAVKVTAYKEKRDFAQVLGGAFYIFETKNSVDSKWKEFLVVKHDDPEPIEKNSINLISDRIGYVFIISKFAVSTDAGETWSIWDIDHAAILKGNRSCRIQGVNMAAQGSGTMTLNCNSSSPILTTNNFGVSWNK